MAILRELAKEAGCMISTEMVMGEILRVLTRVFYMVMTPDDKSGWENYR